MNTAITLENLGKRYRLGQTHNDLLSEKIGNGIRSLCQAFSGKKPGLGEGQSGKASEKEFWALKDVNLSIEKGEVIGIIGRNGAGKSTLLKILSRITEPTTGKITIAGRVGSLLEVGTGFHPELTGRENIFLNGAILGMSKSEIRHKFDEIVAFSEIGKFLDTPVKRYSSGMFVRLAFAVAAHLESEILIVDEVLAVGDSTFQKKCLGKMQDVSKGGRTVLFVSHNMTAIRELCGRAVWLNSGEIVGTGNTKEIVSGYLQENTRSVKEQIWPDAGTAPGNDRVRLRLARLINKGEENTSINVHSPLDVEIEYWNLVPGTELNLSLHLYNLEGTCVFNSNSSPHVYPAGRIREVCHIPGDLLNDGTYRVVVMVDQDRSFGIYTHDDVLVFDVLDAEREINWYGKWPGLVRPNLRWTTEYLDGTEAV